MRVHATYIGPMFSTNPSSCGIFVRYTADEYFMEDSDSEGSEDEAMSDEDPDWQKTPLFKRIKKLKGPIHL